MDMQINLPWKAREGKSGTHIYDSYGQKIGVFGNQGTSLSMDRANSEYAVRAVGMHEVLVTALRSVMQSLRDFVPVEGYDVHYIAADVDRARKRLEKAWDLLEKNQYDELKGARK
jgi:hypothetical protein